MEAQLMFMRLSQDAQKQKIATELEQLVEQENFSKNVSRRGQRYIEDKIFHLLDNNTSVL